MKKLYTSDKKRFLAYHKQIGYSPPHDCVGLAQWPKNHQPASDGNFEREWVNARFSE